MRPAARARRIAAIFCTTNAMQGMQYDQPCSWKDQNRPTMFIAASLSAGDDKGLRHLVKLDLVMLVML